MKRTALLSFTFMLAHRSRAQTSVTPLDTSIGFTAVQPVVPGSLCPESAPCASENGFCGIGRNCLAGCNPLSSFKPAACFPVPACVNGRLSFDKSMLNGPHWDGDSTNYDFIVDSAGRNLSTSTDLLQQDELMLGLTKQANGTALSSTHSVLYGNVTARINAIAAPGVVTSFILLGGTGDEIDFEFTSNTSTIGTSFFWQGDLNDYNSSMNVPVNDRSSDFHDYGIIWTPESIIWTLDRMPIRQVDKNDTLDAATGLYHFPQTPMRIQLLIWGVKSEEATPGELDWAGGAVDWTKAGTEAGFASYVQSVTVACAEVELQAVPSGVVTSSINPSSSGSDLSATTSFTPSLWWTPIDYLTAAPSTTSAAAAATQSAQPSVWWQPLPLLRRAVSNVPAYAWGDLDSVGQLGVSSVEVANVIDSTYKSGLDMQGSPDSGLNSLGSSAVSSGGPSTGSATASNSASASETGKSSNSGSSDSSSTATITDKSSSALGSSTSSSSSTTSASPSPSSSNDASKTWNDFPVAARVGIVLGSALGALLLIAIVAWTIRRCVRAREMKHAEQGTYAPILNSSGGLRDGPFYTGTGEIHPGQDLYQGGQAPAVAVTRKPTFVGGYRPSSQAAAARYVPPETAIMSQYAPGYRPASQRSASSSAV